MLTGSLHSFIQVKTYDVRAPLWRNLYDISVQYWTRLFLKTRKPRRTLLLDNQVYTVIGEMPPRFNWAG
jgi:hypothetical protein